MKTVILGEQQMDLKAYKNIIIIGSPGSGKSWLSRKLAEKTGYPLFHLDKELRRENDNAPREEQIARQKEIISGEKWIIDGNWNDTMELRFAAADFIIFLDINRIVCLFSAVKRQGKERSDKPDGIKERIISKSFFNLCGFIWSYHKTGKNKVLSLREKYPDKPLLIINNRSQMTKLL